MTTRPFRPYGEAFGKAEASNGLRGVRPCAGSAVLWPGYVGGTALLRMPAAVVVIRLLGGPDSRVATAFVVVAVAADAEESGRWREADTVTHQGCSAPTVLAEPA